jgi:predicted DNA-binding transcriptional regulator AlpA
MPYLTVSQLSTVSTVPAPTLYRWAQKYDPTAPIGPRPMRLGPRVIRYATADAATWLGESVETLIARLQPVNT